MKKNINFKILINIYTLGLQNESQKKKPTEKNQGDNLIRKLALSQNIKLYNLHTCCGINIIKIIYKLTIHSNIIQIIIIYVFYPISKLGKLVTF